MVKGRIGFKLDIGVYLLGSDVGRVNDVASLLAIPMGLCFDSTRVASVTELYVARDPMARRAGQ